MRALSAVAVLALVPAWAAPVRAADVQVMFFNGGDPAPADRAAAIPGDAKPESSIISILRALAAGPDAAERREGLRSAFPPGTTIDAVAVDGHSATITLAMEPPPPAHDAAAWDDLQVQVIGTLGATHLNLREFRLLVRTGGRVVPLEELLAIPRALPGATAISSRALRAEGAPAGALDGRRVAISPGHGWVWNGKIWSPQRSDVGGLVEDFLTADICLHWLVPYLERAGAQVITARERDFGMREVVLENGVPGYAEQGAWRDGTGAGGHRQAFRTASAAAGVEARYTMSVPEPGAYRVSLWYVPGPDRTGDARVVVGHARGTSVFHVDESFGVPTWEALGPFFFYDTATVTISPGAGPGAVVADAVRLGGGVGSIDRGGGISLKPRWQEAARYFTQYAGAPASVYEANGVHASDHSNDVVSRPLFAAWSQAELFLSVHTNAYNGAQSGTETYAYSGAATPGSTQLRALVNAQVVGDVRAEWDPLWIDRGEKAANFGEVREARGMPAALVELAFHDGTRGVRDQEYLHDARFKRLLGRALYRAIAAYFAPGKPFIAEPPAGVSLVNSGPGELTASWSPVPGADGYRVHLSRDGCGTDEGLTAGGTTLVLPGLALGGTYFARVTAVNAGGESLPSPAVAARVADERAWVPLLLVHAFDRLDDEVQIEDNPGIWMVPHAVAAAEAGWFFDGATHEAVGASTLNRYLAVDWILGRQSKGSGPFTPGEQALVAAYLDAGGALLASGTDVAWGLGSNGGPSDQAFLRDYLKASFSDDDAGIHQAAPVAGGLFDGVPPFSFDDGTHGTYDAANPDVIAPEGSAAVLEYAGGKTAAVSFAGTHRLVYLAFPFETIYDHATAVAVMGRALRFLAGAPPPEGEGKPETSGADGGAGADAGAACGTGAVRCSDEGAVELCVSGAWVAAGACAPGSLCIDGRCLLAGQCAGVKPAEPDPVSMAPNGCGCTTMGLD